jgi:hypothetical protein
MGGDSDGPDQQSHSDFSSCGSRAIWLGGTCMTLPREPDEDKNRPAWNSASAGVADRVRMAQLATVVAGMSLLNREATVSALGHWLSNTGGYGVVPPTQMMQDLPFFNSDVIKNIRLGSFDSGWQSDTVSDHPVGAKAADWMYALNGFQYRVIGQTELVDGSLQGSMTVEVYKRYNFGNVGGGEPRNTLHAPLGMFSLSQNDLAHLNTVGLAQDYDVVGITNIDISQRTG